MIAHVVLFTPRPDLSADEWNGLLGALKETTDRVRAVRRLRVGPRVMHGLAGYEQAMRDHYAYAAIVEFDDLDGLKSYLAHPAHAALGAHFTTSAARALAYDYEIGDWDEMAPAKNPSIISRS